MLKEEQVAGLTPWPMQGCCGHSGKQGHHGASPTQPKQRQQLLMLDSLIKGHEEKNEKPTVMEEAQHEKNVVAMILELALVAVGLNENMWILDTGAMKHITRNPKSHNGLQHGNDSISM